MSKKKTVVMPRVKIEYVVSFSSEDPEHRAANLLAGEVSKKKWLCSKGEPSCSVVLQLACAVEISAIHIGAYHAALVEVLVGLSERPNDPFQVLVPSCVFVPPAQSRRDEGVSRVRSFTGEELAADARGKRYDRLRVVCSQPYNKHCQYGLSFVHIHEPESRADAPPVSAAAVVPSRLLALDTFSSDDEDFRPGELFVEHFKSPNSTGKPEISSTDAQIRQATSHALKNISDPSTKLLKMPISTSRQKQTEEVPINRQRNNLMYTEDDARPHSKIDRVVNRHKVEKTKEDELNKPKIADKNKHKEKNNDGDSENSKKNKNSDDKNIRTNKDTPTVSTSRNKQTDQSNNHQKNVQESSNCNSDRKRKHDDNRLSPAVAEMGEVHRDVSRVLRGVTLALSGYAGAQRAALRDTALALGARYCPDWTPRCTHLICAFPNTPKLRTARASGALVGAATGEWLENCLEHRRRLPWRWYATDPAERTPSRPPLPPPQSPDTDIDEDDSDEGTNKHKDMDARSTPSPKAAWPMALEATLPDNDVVFVKDERYQGQAYVPDSTDEDDLTDHVHEMSTEERIDTSKALPDFFEGYTFVISDEMGEKIDREILARYVHAFGGLVIQASEVKDSKVDYVVYSEKSPRGAARGETLGEATRVRPSWVWRCARERRLCAVDDEKQTRHSHH